MKVNITGKLSPGVYAKDVILGLIGKIGVNGATNRVMEFSGNVVDAMTMEQRMTLCNMAVEAGATSGICAPDPVTVDYLWPFIKGEYATKEDALTAFQAFAPDADAVYSDVIDFHVTDLVPQVTFGYKPDQVKPVAEMAGIPIQQVYIGSCTNGRFEDLEIAAGIIDGKTDPSPGAGHCQSRLHRTFTAGHFPPVLLKSSWMPVFASPIPPAVPALV